LLLTGAWRSKRKLRPAISAAAGVHLLSPSKLQVPPQVYVTVPLLVEWKAAPTPMPT
jgi:hypothetical protein